MRGEAYPGFPDRSVMLVTEGSGPKSRASLPVTMACDRSLRRAGSNWGRLARQVSCPAHRGTQGRPVHEVMLRLLHTADVHLGARHADLGDRAAAQRERQFAAFVATVDLALAEKVDLVLIAGDLFDSNTQPRRSVERAAAQIKRLVDARIRVVIAPGTHDVYDKASIYRAFDLPALAGAVGSDLVTVLDPDHHDVHLQALDAVVHGRCFATKRAPASPLAGLDVSADGRATWHIGLLHAALAIEGRTDGDDVVVRTEEIEASHLDYLALGHWHSTSKGKAGDTTYAYAGAPEPIALDQDRAGNVLLVTLDGAGASKRVAVEERRVGR